MKQECAKEHYPAVPAERSEPQRTVHSIDIRDDSFKEWRASSLTPGVSHTGTTSRRDVRIHEHSGSLLSHIITRYHRFYIKFPDI